MTAIFTNRYLPQILVVLFLIAALTASAQQKIRVIKTDKTVWKINEDGKQVSNWSVMPEIKPDVREVYITGQSKKVAFVNENDSLQFTVKPGETHSFIFLVNGKDSAFTEIKGIKEIENPTFSEAYIRTNKGRTFVEIPPVYELINIVFALTQKGKEHKGLIIKDTPYYQDLINWFGKYENEPIVTKINAMLAEDFDYYFPLKMNSYAFDFSDQGRIVQSKTYDRITWNHTNILKPHIADLQNFANKTNAREFLKRHKSFYEAQIVTYRDSIGLPAMQKWLNLNFPSTRYDSFKIIFSPLVGAYQSAIWFENNGFKEAQAHVNFPYRNPESLKSFSKEALLVREGNIVFTELNHSFINPEGEKPEYKQSIISAFEDIEIWNEKGKPAGDHYNNAYASFNEHMNWALVSLRYTDLAPKSEQDKLISAVEKMMVESRGFKKFGAFNQFLVNQYRNRKPRQTVANLYPEIVKWFVANK